MMLTDPEEVQAHRIGEDGVVDDVAHRLRMGDELAVAVLGEGSEGVESELDLCAVHVCHVRANAEEGGKIPCPCRVRAWSGGRGIGQPRTSHRQGAGKEKYGRISSAAGIKPNSHAVVCCVCVESCVVRGN